MSKTNHQRDFQAEKIETPPGDWCCGKHGAAKNKRGQKKFLRTRRRMDLKMHLLNASKTNEVEDLGDGTRKKWQFKGVSKLRVIGGNHNGEGYGPHSHDFLTKELGYTLIAPNVYKIT